MGSGRKTLTTLTLLLPALFALLVPFACVRPIQVSPSNKSTSTPTRTSTPTPVCPLPASGLYLSGGVGRVVVDYPPTMDKSDVLIVLAQNSIPNDSAQVVFMGQGVSFHLVPTGYVRYICGEASMFRGDPLAPAWNYVPGQAYTITVTTSLGTASASGIAPGGITHAPNGSQSSWTVEGLRDEVQVTTVSTILYQSPCCDVSSPLSVPASAYPGSGTYYLTTKVSQPATFTGAVSPGCVLSFSDELYSRIVY